MLTTSIVPDLLIRNSYFTGKERTKFSYGNGLCTDWQLVAPEWKQQSLFLCKKSCSTVTDELPVIDVGGTVILGIFPYLFQCLQYPELRIGESADQHIKQIRVV